VLQLCSEVTPRGFVDPQLQKIRKTRWRNTTNDPFGLLPIVIERDLAAVRETHVALLPRDDHSDPVAHGLLRGFVRPFLRLGCGLWLLSVRRVTVELRVLEVSSTNVVEDCEVTLVDVLTESSSAPLHLLVEDGAAERTCKDDVLNVRRVESRSQQ